MLKLDHLACLCCPVTNISPLREMKVSRPQHLIPPVEKCGNPAAREGVGFSLLLGVAVASSCRGTEVSPQQPNNWT